MLSKDYTGRNIIETMAGSWFAGVEAFYLNIREIPREQAVDEAVRECIGRGILGDFLKKHRAEVKNVILTEFDEELYRQLVYKEGREDGEAAGLTEGRRRDVLELLEELGPVPEELREKIMSQENQDVLSRWLKTAARAESLQGFAEKMDGSK